MEAPEKIYIEVTPDGTRYYRDVVKEQRTENSDIEYIRKDTFIEKAENFLEMLGYGFTITDNITHKNYDKEQLIADFRNYIK